MALRVEDSTVPILKLTRFVLKWFFCRYRFVHPLVMGGGDTHIYQQ